MCFACGVTCAASGTSTTSFDSGRYERGPTAAPDPAILLRTERRRCTLVQGRRHLPAQCEVVLRLERRWHRRLPGPDLETRLHPRSRGQHHLADAVLSIAAQGRRLRHRRLRERAPAVRHPGRFSRHVARGASARSQGRHRTGHQSHLRPASLVPGRAPSRRPVRPSASSTSGAIPTRNISAHASSSSIPRLRTGPGIRSPRRTTGIDSSATSRI